MKDKPLTTEELLARINRPLPESLEAEKGVISCMLQAPERRIEEARLHVPLEAFSRDALRIMYLLLLEMADRNLPIGPIEVTHLLKERNLIDKVGGPAEITELFAFIPIPAHWPFYVRIIREKLVLRQLIAANLNSAWLAFEHGKEQDEVEVAQLVRAAQEMILAVDAEVGSEGLQCTPLKDLVAQVIEDAQTQAECGATMTGITTGIPAIDAITGGLDTGCLTVIAAESSDGKSSLCRQMLEAVAIEGHCAVDYTYEMMPKTEARRILCSQGRIDAKNLKMGMLTRGEQNALVSQLRKISSWDMHIVDVAGKTIEQICRDIARRSRKLASGKRLVAMIDYIQLCKTAAATKSREREVAHITATAKQCAKMTGAHILMPSQQNKAGDVRESMAIEQDADTLIQIQKVKTASDKPAWKRDDDEEEVPNNTRRIFFKKVRDGERYTHVMMELIGRHYRFEAVNADDEIFP